MKHHAIKLAWNESCEYPEHHLLLCHIVIIMDPTEKEAVQQPISDGQTAGINKRASVAGSTSKRPSFFIGDAEGQRIPVKVSRHVYIKCEVFKCASANDFRTQKIVFQAFHNLIIVKNPFAR